MKKKEAAKEQARLMEEIAKQDKPQENISGLLSDLNNMEESME